MVSLTRLFTCCLLILALACPALAKTYQCVKPGGKTVCTVDSASAPGADPSVLCNKTCQECYLTCQAVEVIHKQGGSVGTGVAPGAGSDNMVTPSGSDKDTARKVLQQGIVQ